MGCELFLKCLELQLWTWLLLQQVRHLLLKVVYHWSVLLDFLFYLWSSGLGESVLWLRLRLSRDVLHLRLLLWRVLLHDGIIFLLYFLNCFWFFGRFNFLCGFLLFRRSNGLYGVLFCQLFWFFLAHHHSELLLLSFLEQSLLLQLVRIYFEQ
jgi:hypothetical protein